MILYDYVRWCSVSSSFFVYESRYLAWCYGVVGVGDIRYYYTSCMFVGCGILPPVYTYSWRYVVYGTPPIISLFSRRHFICGTQSFFFCVFYIHDATSSAASRRSTFVNSASFVLRVHSLRHPVAFRLPRSPRHIVATLRRSSPRSSSTVQRFNLADVQPRHCAVVPVTTVFYNFSSFHVTAVTWLQHLLMQILHRELSFPRSSMVNTNYTTNFEGTNTEDTICLLKTATTATVTVRHCIIVGLAHEMFFFSFVAQHNYST